MSKFKLDHYIQELRDAATKPDALKQVRRVMKVAFTNPEAVKLAMAEYSGEAEILFEDETVSIWYCGFDPNIHVPPHDHQMIATIGVYEGLENNHFYHVRDGELQPKSTHCLRPGDVISFGPDTIHSVETADDHSSHGLHTYLGPLTKKSRSLFDWDTGARRPFTDADYDRMKRTSII